MLNQNTAHLRKLADRAVVAMNVLAGRAAHVLADRLIGTVTLGALDQETSVPELARA